MIPLFKSISSPQAIEAVAEVLRTGMTGEGPKVKEFKYLLSSLFNHGFVVPTNSCSSALVMALKLAGVGYKSKVISTPFTFLATNTSIVEVGGDIIWGDIEPETLCLDTRSVLEVINRPARYGTITAVVMTLVGGTVPLQFDLLVSRLRERGIPLILDCAHALGTFYKGKHISHYGDFSCYSFQSIKHLSTGDGGALVCNDKSDFKLAEQLKWFGLSRKVPEGMTRLEYQMTQLPIWNGHKYHMNDIAAAIGIANFDIALEALQSSRENADFFNTEIPNINNELKPLYNPDCNSSYWVYGFTYPDRYGTPLEVSNRFIEKEITTSPLWPMNNKYQAFSRWNLRTNIYKPNAIFIPNGYWVGESEKNVILEAIREVF